MKFYSSCRNMRLLGGETPYHYLPWPPELTTRNFHLLKSLENCISDKTLRNKYLEDTLSIIRFFGIVFKLLSVIIADG